MPKKTGNHDSTEWDRNFVNQTCNRGLIFRIYKESNLSQENELHIFKKGEYGTERESSPKKKQKISKKSKCPLSLAIKKMQILMLQLYDTTIRIVKINKAIDSKCQRGCVERGNLFTFGGIANWFSHSGKQCEEILKRLERHLLCDSATSHFDVC